MKYRLAGATYRVIAEKLTEERAREYADANGISIERAMKKIKHVSTKTAAQRVFQKLSESTQEAIRSVYGDCLRGYDDFASIFLAGWPTSKRC